MGKAPLWRRGHRRPQAPESRVDPERPLSSSPLILRKGDRDTDRSHRERRQRHRGHPLPANVPRRERRGRGAKATKATISDSPAQGTGVPSPVVSSPWLGPPNMAAHRAGTTTLSAALKKPVSPGPWGGVGWGGHGAEGLDLTGSCGAGWGPGPALCHMADHITHPGPAQELTHTRMHTVC